MVKLHWEGSAPADCAASFFSNNFIIRRILRDWVTHMYILASMDDLSPMDKVLFGHSGLFKI